MLVALAADFALLDDCSVEVLRDARLGPWRGPDVTVRLVESCLEEEQAFLDCAKSVDWTIVIAPELSGYLHHRVKAVLEAGARLLGLDPRGVALASDKQKTAEHLTAHGVPCTKGIALARGEKLPEGFAYPAVLKPRDGAGSQGVVLIDRPQRAPITAMFDSRLEELCPGMPVSVAFLCGPGQLTPLPPCWQRLAGQGDFSYFGGRVPIEPGLAQRATQLAMRAVRTLADPLGYLGVDLVLGREPTGTEDRVIEINPRLTTSYVGLRALSDRNLAGAMLDVARGRPAKLCWKSGTIDFDCAGEVRWVGE